MGEYKPVSPVQLEIDPMTIETYISVFDALKLDEGIQQMTIVYDATRGVWTVVLSHFETEGLLEFMANVHMELPQEVKKPEDIWEGTSDGPAELSEEVVGQVTRGIQEAEEGKTVSVDFREPEFEPAEDSDETFEESLQNSFSTSTGKVVKLKRPTTVQKSGAISVEED